MTRTAIVTICSDETHVYGYVSAYPVDENGVELENARLPRAVEALCEEQHDSTTCRSVCLAEKEAVSILRRGGWRVLDPDLTERTS